MKKILIFSAVLGGLLIANQPKPKPAGRPTIPPIKGEAEPIKVPAEEA